VSLPFSIADVVPHRPPSLLLDELVEADDKHAVSLVRITERSPFFEGQGVPAVVTLEYMAQTVAAYSGALRRGLGQQVQLGFLLACRRLTLTTDLLRPGDELRVEARHVWSAPPLGQFDCQVTRGDQTIANATLSVYEGALEDAPSE
jgi:predicted hotdog family 3-hydroxylacyl-ACP dehydratase